MEKNPECEPSPEPAAAETTVPGDTWICPKCGAVNQISDELCQICESEEGTWICDCGTKNAAYRLTCVDCLQGKP